MIDFYSNKNERIFQIVIPQIFILIFIKKICAIICGNQGNE